jgi:hypothetical protein
MLNVSTSTLNCPNENTNFYISLTINLVLGIITAISEIMSISKCPSNGIIDGIKKTITNRNIEIDDNYV